MAKISVGVNVKPSGRVIDTTEQVYQNRVYEITHRQELLEKAEREHAETQTLIGFGKPRVMLSKSCSTKKPVTRKKGVKRMKVYQVDTTCQAWKDYREGKITHAEMMKTAKIVEVKAIRKTSDK